MARRGGRCVRGAGGVQGLTRASTRRLRRQTLAVVRGSPGAAAGEAGR